jgi:hypothetical protein
MNEHSELKKWLKKNGQHLRGYAPDEIAYLAITCGFTGPDLYAGLNDHLGHLKRLFTLWESPFLEQWLSLCSYNRGDD